MESHPHAISFLKGTVNISRYEKKKPSCIENPALVKTLSHASLSMNTQSIFSDCDSAAVYGLMLPLPVTRGEGVEGVFLLVVGVWYGAISD